MPKSMKAPIGIELVKHGVVTEEDINQALEYQKEHPKKKIGDIINILGLANSRELIRVMGEVLGEKVMLLTKESLRITPTDYISIDIAKRCKAIPFDIKDGMVKVCFADTANKAAIEQIRLIFLNRGLEVEKYLTFETNIENVNTSLEGRADEKIVTEGDITGLVDTIIKSAIEKRASDIHIEPMEKEVRIRFRIDGELVIVGNIAKEKQSQLIGRLKAISNMHQEKQESQDGRINSYSGFNIRVSSQKNVNGEKFCLRMLKRNGNIQKISDLGFPDDEEYLKRMFDNRNSITIVAAPTGEGKTTTLYSIIDFLNSPEINITTIEDPVELRVPGLNQIEIGGKITFADSLRTVLRQDPDIVLVGEIRDLETAEIALQAGQTGHYVLATIHTINAVEVITRLRKIGISDYDISSTLATAVSQRLIRRPCPHCLRKRKFEQKEIDVMNKIVEPYKIKLNFKDKFTYEINGCKKCNYTGYLGRLAAVEILGITPRIREMISNGESTYKITLAAVEDGYQPLVVDAIKKVVDGKLTLEEVNKKLALF